MRAFVLPLVGLLSLAPGLGAAGATAAEICQGKPEAARTDQAKPDPGKPRSHKWWSSEESMAELGISPAQSKELEAIFQSFLPALKSSKEDIDRYQREVSRLLSEASASEVVVLQAIDRLESAQSALSRTRTLMLFRMYRVLTPEQRAKVKQFHDRQSQEPGSPSARR